MHCNQFVKSQRAILMALASVIIASLILSACREKDSPIIGPEPPPTGDWRIALDPTPTLFITIIGEGIEGDTISVRLFRPDNSLAVGFPLRFAADADVDRIVHNATTTDTSGTMPWGSNPALYYWGDGTGDEENSSETVHAYYIDGGDTLAVATQSYNIQLRP